MIVKLDTQRLQTLDQVREFLAGSRPLRPAAADPGRGLCVRGRGPATVRLLPPGEGRQGPDPPLPEQGDRPLTRAGHPPAAPAPDHRSHRRPPPPPAPLPTPLHQGRHRAARRSRCPPRHPLRSGHPQALRPGLAPVRRPAASSASPPSPTDTSTTCATRPAINAAAGRCPRRPAPCTSPSASGAGPRPFGQPGYPAGRFGPPRDLHGIKGLYHLNLVDEVTQFQFVGSVERIDTSCLAPVLEALLRAFPFNVRGFHTDNGSEFINHKIAARLQALHIDEFTKSRPRRSNDNALVESKNGSVIRKHLGYGHIPSRYAERVNAFTQQVLSPYLNFHRPVSSPSMKSMPRAASANATPTPTS